MTFNPWKRLRAIEKTAEHALQDMPVRAVDMFSEHESIRKPAWIGFRRVYRIAMAADKHAEMNREMVRRLNDAGVGDKVVVPFPFPVCPRFEEHGESSVRLEVFDDNRTFQYHCALCDNRWKRELEDEL